jgi:mitochondrial fission protein ELM1
MTRSRTPVTELPASAAAPVSGAPASLAVWLVTDDKPGHRNQLQGLLDALARHAPVSAHWLVRRRPGCSWLDVLRRRYPGPEPARAPDLVVGAGHGTHRDVLALKRRYRAFSVVLMNPSLPLAWFDAAIVPRHDIPVARRERILLTDGVINTVRPAENPDPTRGLILVGGTSSHYDWHSERIAHEVLDLVARFPGVRWQLTDSRRTPPEFLAALGEPLPDNLTVNPHQQTPAGWVATQLRRAGCVWVTPDSVSMVYEALTAGAPTGLFDLAPRRRGRIVRGMEQLLAGAMVNRFSDVIAGRPMQPPAKPLWEAERAALWLLRQDRLARSEPR